MVKKIHKRSKEEPLGSDYLLASRDGPVGISGIRNANWLGNRRTIGGIYSLDREGSIVGLV